jgi:hypothetical protein
LPDGAPAADSVYAAVASYPAQDVATEQQVVQLLAAAKIRAVSAGSAGRTVSVPGHQAKRARAVLADAVKAGALSVVLLDEIRAPKSLRAARTENRLRIDEDATEDVIVPVTVGLTRWKRCELKVYRGKERVAHSGGSYDPPFLFTREADRIPCPGERYEVELVVTWFETDAPVQPNWKPESGGKYKVLHTRTLTLSVGSSR